MTSSEKGKTGLAKRLQKAIQLLGLKPLEAASLCDIPKTNFYKFLSDASKPNTESMLKLSEGLGISIDWLLTGQGCWKLEQGEQRDKAQLEFDKYALLSTQETALLQIFNSLSESAQREICKSAEEKKRLLELEELERRLASVLQPEANRKNVG